MVYLLYWTSVRADRAMDGETDRLQDRWAGGQATTGARHVPGPRRYEDGAPFAIMYINDGTTCFTYRIDKRPHRTLPSDVGVIGGRGRQASAVPAAVRR